MNSLFVTAWPGLALGTGWANMILMLSPFEIIPDVKALTYELNPMSTVTSCVFFSSVLQPESIKHVRKIELRTMMVIRLIMVDSDDNF